MCIRDRLEYSNNPRGNGTGTTPWDNVIVFTYKVVVNKVDQDNNPCLLYTSRCV